jgi:hypothetical protein
MGRIFLLTAALYGYGDPGFDGRRPASLDRPLHGLHRSIDAVASEMQGALVTADRSGALQALPKLGDKLRQIGEALAPG